MVKIIYFEQIFYFVLFFYVKYQFGLEIHSLVISKIRRLHKSVSSGGDHVWQSGHALKFRQAPKKFTDAYIW